MSKNVQRLFIFLLFPCISYGSDEKHFQSGNAFVGEQKLTLPTDASQIPGYKGTHVAESMLESSSITGALNKKSQQKDNISSFIHETHDQRLRFKIDPKTDPVFTESDKIIADPLKVLQAEKTEVKTASKTIRTKHTCEESGEPYEVSCKNSLHVKVTPYPSVLVTFTFSLPSLWNNHRPFWSRYFSKGMGRHSNPNLDFGGDNKGGDASYARHYFYASSPERDETFLHDLLTLTKGKDALTGAVFSHDLKGLKLKKVSSLRQYGDAAYSGQNFFLWRYGQVELEQTPPPDIEESWISDCEALEQKIDQGLCTYVSRLCTQKNQTRVINGISVTRPCWEEALTYACQPTSHRGCEEFKKKGCVQINSQCKEYKGKSCITFTQTYECLSQQDGQTLTTLSGKIPYCLDGQCVDQGFAPNEDMAEVLSTLAILNAIQKDKDMSGPSIFKGEAYGCNRNCINFKDCCGSGDGWGVSMGLAGCSEKEKALAELRPQSKCVYVGTYCAEKAPILGCIRKKSNYCCFGSKMARLIQEQGRKQLHISFGSADSPQCRGLTVEELGKIDFSKVDLSELFAEVWSKMKAPNVQKLSEDFQQSWSDRNTVLKESQKPYRDHLQQEKPDAVF